MSGAPNDPGIATSGPEGAPRTATGNGEHLRQPRGVSIVYITHRREPAFAWFADSLAAQLGPGDELELIVVDGLHGRERTAQFERIVAGRLPLRHVPPKPTPWNGPHRLTRGEYFAPASARNTGIVHASKPYIVFADDASVLMCGWWREAKRGASEGWVIAGAYQKHREMVVRNGILLSSRPDPGGIDCRWERGDDARPVAIGGGELFGNGIGAPHELLLELNGFDELCDPGGGEDYQLGMRIEFAGVPIRYCRAMLAIESEELHAQPVPLKRKGKAAEPAAYMRRLREFGVRARSTAGPTDISHMVLDILYGTRSTQTMGNYYSLRTMRESDLVETVARFPSHHWFDQQPLAEM